MVIKKLKFLCVLLYKSFTHNNTIVHFLKNFNRNYETEKQKDNFIATLIHDLKNSLIAQIRIFDLLINDKYGKLNKLQSQIIKQTQTSSQYNLNLLMSALYTYKHEDGQLHYSMNTFDIVKVINELAAEASELLDNPNEILIEIQDTPTLVYADELLIRRVITNLLVNAIQYHKVNTKIKISLTHNENNITLKIINYSNFYSEKDLKNLFQKYISTNSKTLGTGLGLYIAKQIIKQHNGYMICESLPNGLNTFGFVLPDILIKNKKCVVNLQKSCKFT